MVDLTVSIDRTSLSLPPLVLSNDPTGVYVIPEDALVEPEFDERASFADDSPHVAGSLLTQSVLGLGSWACSPLNVHGADPADLKANKRALEAALRQFRFEATITIVGAPDTYSCIRGKVSWGTVDSGVTRANMARASITVPCQPLGA